MLVNVTGVAGAPKLELVRVNSGLHNSGVRINIPDDNSSLTSYAPDQAAPGPSRDMQYRAPAVFTPRSRLVIDKTPVVCTLGNRHNQFIILPKNGRKIGFAEFGDPDGIPVFVFSPLAGTRLFAVWFDSAAKKHG